MRSSEFSGGRGEIRRSRLATLTGTLVALSLAACSGESGGRQQSAAAQSCMQCHNGAQDANDYSGPGLENPHPFTGAANLLCTDCHGGNPAGADKLASHVPAPPEIGDREQWNNDPYAYFNRLTRAGLDTLDDYQANGRNWTALDYLQFINPGDLRVVSRARGCGRCHEEHGESVNQSMLATSTGIFSAAMFTVGVEGAVPENQSLYGGTASDLAFRAIADQSFSSGSASVGAVGRLAQFPVYSERDSTDPGDIFQNQAFTAANLADDRNADGSLVTGSELAKLFHEQVSFTCGDCHMGSSGANNRYGDFRSSGCTACHMPYSQSGRSGSGDPNINANEPLNPDAIDDPELPHVRRHMLSSVAKTVTTGEFVPGIDDHTCAGCHQGSNRTVMQYWGIRLDQNQDVVRGNQYPANPVTHQTTNGDTRLFDPAVGNNTFNGRNRNQYLLREDYDGDGRDDTPADVHYEAGLGCIDCHGSADLHNGDPLSGNPELLSRMEQGVAVRCESCHGTVEEYAPTESGTNYQGETAQLTLDAKGHTMRHVERDGQGDYWLRSRLTGELHYVVQVRDLVVDSGRQNPLSGEDVYSPRASYAMGRADGDPANGLGPLQDDDIQNGYSGFSHMDNMSCASCHAAWTNSCIGCHLRGEYDNGNNFSNITGERIVYKQANADFTYQSPVFFQLGIGPNDKVEQIMPNTLVFYGYRDLNGADSEVFSFTDRNGGGSNQLTARFPSLAHNVMMPHSIRGKVEAANEGPRYCVACHLTDNSLGTWSAEYGTLRNALATGNFAALDFDLLRTHIGQNPGNQLDSPLWVHMVSGLGSGLFLFDEHGCPVNPLDDNDARVGCNGVSPADTFDLGRVRLDLDRIVEADGTSNGSNSHPMASGGTSSLRDGPDAAFAGPLGAEMIERLTDPLTGIVLDAWLDADGENQGHAPDFLPP